MRALALAAVAAGLALSVGLGHQVAAQTATATATITPTVTSQGISPPPPPPLPNQTFVPPPAPGATATPAPTATALPLTLAVRLSHGTVKPGEKQRISVTTLPGTALRFVVRFPNGYTKKHTAKVGASGATSWTFTQPGNRIAHDNRTAQVTVQTTAAGRSIRAVKRYTIAFGTVDIVISPHSQSPGHSVTIWVHSSAHSIVRLVLAARGRPLRTLPLRTGGDGWLQLRYVIPTGTKKEKIDVSASVGTGKKSVTARTNFSIT